MGEEKRKMKMEKEEKTSEKSLEYAQLAAHIFSKCWQ